MNYDELKERLKVHKSGVISWHDERRIAGGLNIDPHIVESKALEQQIIPGHYLRNIGSISADEQKALLTAKIGVIGCGGLGGYVIEYLARLGVGSIIGWDYDVFEEHNINRQLGASFECIGDYKTEIISKRLQVINPVVNFVEIHEKFNMENGKQFLKECHVIIDALDNISDKLQLANVCESLNIPLVHGAVEGWYGQVFTQYPGDQIMPLIYKKRFNNDSEPISTLSFTPAIIAGIQAAETTRILLGKQNLLRFRILLLDLMEMSFDIIEINK